MTSPSQEEHKDMHHIPGPNCDADHGTGLCTAHQPVPNEPSDEPQLCQCDHRVDEHSESRSECHVPDCDCPSPVPSDSPVLMSEAKKEWVEGTRRRFKRLEQESAIGDELEQLLDELWDTSGLGRLTRNWHSEEKIDLQIEWKKIAKQKIQTLLEEQTKLAENRLLEKLMKKARQSGIQGRLAAEAFIEASIKERSEDEDS